MAIVRKRELASGKKSARWYMRYKDSQGKWTERVGFTDKAESLKEANRLETQAALVASGAIVPESEARRTGRTSFLGDQVQDYRAGLIAKGRTPKHAGHVAGVLVDLIETADFHAVDDVSSDKVQAVLAEWRTTKSARTVSHALKAFMAFLRWMHDANRIAELPRGLKGLVVPQVGGGGSRKRRALTPDEVEGLIVVTMHSKKDYTVKGRVVSGLDRARLYRFALETGFRAEEIRSVTLASFDFDADNPSVFLPAAKTKGGKTTGKDTRQPLRRYYARILERQTRRLLSSGPLFTFPTRTAEMLAHDLREAGIPVIDEAGRVVDFHSLRHTYVTSLVNRGLPVKAVQALARHSDVRITLELYTHLSDGDIRKLLEGE